MRAPAIVEDLEILEQSGGQLDLDPAPERLHGGHEPGVDHLISEGPSGVLRLLAVDNGIFVRLSGGQYHRQGVRDKGPFCRESIDNPTTRQLEVSRTTAQESLPSLRRARRHG
jgi:hypothetical protein